MMWLRACVVMALCLSATGAWAQGTPVEQASDEQKQAASEAFQAAKEAFNEGRFEEALSGFRASYTQVASPNAKLMIAATLRELGRKAEAWVVFGEVAVEASAAAQADPKYQATADAAIHNRGELRNEIGLLTVAGLERATEDAVLTIDGREIPRDRWHEPIAVDPGERTVTLTSQPPQTVTVAAGADAHVDLSPKEAPPDTLTLTPADLAGDEGPDKLLIAIISGGVSAAGFVSFAIFGGLALSQFGDLEDACPDMRCPAALQGDADSGQTFQVVANVSLAVGIIGAAVAGGFLAWHFLDPAEEDVTATLEVGPGALQVTGRF